MNAPTLETITDTITSDVSPYKLAALVSKLVGRTIKPQMLYNYCKKGMIPTNTNDLGHIVVSVDDARTWAAKYMNGSQK